MELNIRLVEEQKDYWAVEEISKAAWSLADFREVIPAHLMITFQQNGGLLLGAWLDGKLVGFSVSFVGLTSDGRVKLCSEQLGILPEYQSLNIGYQLKLAQRNHILARGIDHITWTFDPLETKNGNLNMHKLGVVCNTYLINIYGTAAGINAGLPTDRFQVDWWLDSQHVSNRLTAGSPNTLAGLLAEGVPVVNTAVGDPFPRPPEHVLPFDGRPALLQLPVSIRALKQADMPLALAWRMHTRELFLNAFAQGYAASDLLFTPESCYYLLETVESPRVSETSGTH
jgi:predicted GNAT superfamily acetyltransferase